LAEVKHVFLCPRVRGSFRVVRANWNIRVSLTETSIVADVVGDVGDDILISVAGGDRLGAAGNN
jgi:hypothetical protein